MTIRTFSHSWLITGIVSVTRRLSHVYQEHSSSSPVFSEVCVTRSLVLCVCFVDCSLSFCTFFFWPLCCLFFELLILITALVSSNSYLVRFILLDLCFFLCNVVYIVVCLFFLPLYCMFIVDLPLLITSLVSSMCFLR